MLAKPVIRQLDKEGFQLRLFSRTVNPSMFYNDYDIMQGDVLNTQDLEKATDGCDAVHISLSKVNEAKAVQEIVTVCRKNGIKLISMVSGCTVSEENRWFWMIDNKYQAEQAIIKSGIPYVIFRPSWFFESLDLMIRNGKAMMLGKQPVPYHWVAADDYARMVGEACLKPEAKNNIYYVLGPKPYLMKDLLEKYCNVCYPEISKVTSAPLGLMKCLAAITRNKELKSACELFAYFEKTKEPELSGETDSVPGKPEITFEKWLEMKE